MMRNDVLRSRVARVWRRRAVRRAALSTFCVAVLTLLGWSCKLADAQTATSSQPFSQQTSRANPSRANAQNTSNASARRTPFLQGLFGGSSARQPSATLQRDAANAQKATTLRGFFGAQSGQDFHASSQHLPTGLATSRVGAPSGDMLAQASSDPQDAREALAKIPWNALPQATSDKLQRLAATATTYRRLPMAGGRCNPELFDFFLTYPHAIVELWKEMGYDEISMTPQGADRYVVREKNGSAAVAQVLYQDSDLALAYVSGIYRGMAFLRPVEGEAMLVLQTRYTEDATKTPLVVCRLDAFISIKNPGVDFLARTFNATVGKIADSNFEQTLAFVDSVSQTAEQSPREFQNVVANLSGLSPDARAIFAQKARDVAFQAARRQRGEIVDYKLLAKRNAPNPGYARILARGNEYRPGARESDLATVAAPSVGEFGAGRAFASSGLGASSGRAEGFSTSSPSLSRSSFGSDFALAEDESEFDDWDSEGSMMTGEEYLASKVGGSFASRAESSSPTSSLARIGAQPATKTRAIKMLDEQEESLSASTSAPSTISTDELEIDEEFVLSDEFDVASDEETPVGAVFDDANAPGEEELYIDEQLLIEAESADDANYANDSNDSLEIDPAPPQPLGATSLPLTVRNAPPTVHAPGAAKKLDVATQAAPLAAENEMTTNLAPYAEALTAESASDEPTAHQTDANSEEEEEDLGANWRRAPFAISRDDERPAGANRPLKTLARKVEANAKKTEANLKKIERKIKDELDDDARPKLITRRYSASQAQKAKENKSNNAKFGGEPLSTFKWTPATDVEDVPKTALATDSVPSSSVPAFRKPEIVK